jgi:tripartite-type tricarboxylate transporter receptor subunit TctC
VNLHVTSAGAVAATIALALVPDASAQAWPAKTVRIVMPFPPGGGTDQMGRLLAKRFTETLGPSFFAENRPGAGGRRGLVSRRPVCGERRIGPR